MKLVSRKKSFTKNVYGNLKDIEYEQIYLVLDNNKEIPIKCVNYLDKQELLNACEKIVADIK